jgi:hypothetical protein
MIHVRICLLIVLAALIEVPAFAASHDSTTTGSRSVGTEPVPVISDSQLKAKELWDNLSEDDRAFVTSFIKRENLSVLAPQLLLFRESGRTEEAIGMMQRIYKIDDPEQAEIILKLLAYAHDQE